MRHSAASGRTKERNALLARRQRAGSPAVPRPFHGLLLPPSRARRVCDRRDRGRRGTLPPPRERPCRRPRTGGHDQSRRGPRRGTRNAGGVPLPDDVPVRRAGRGYSLKRRIRPPERSFRVGDRRRSGSRAGFRRLSQTSRTLRLPRRSLGAATTLHSLENAL